MVISCRIHPPSLPESVLPVPSTDLVQHFIQGSLANTPTLCHRCQTSWELYNRSHNGRLHTWGQDLMLHPHVHCIVPGGGLSNNGKWKNARSKGNFLFPVIAMTKVFRAKFVAMLRKSELTLPNSCNRQCFQKEWVVYAKRLFLGPRQVIEYLGRYTHKIAISNHRIQDLANIHRFNSVTRITS